MFDELLGRATLKEEIAELEEEREQLRRQLEAESDRRAEAVHARQDAEERANRLEDRIAELEDRVERLQGDEPELDFRGTETLSGSRLEAVLDRLSGFETGPEGAFTAMVRGQDAVPEAVRDAFGDRTGLVSRAAPCLALTDDAGLVSVALSPAVPPEAFGTWGDGFGFEREWFLPTGEFGFALVRSDRFAFGEYDGRTRTSFTGFTSDVKGNHTKGGFSQGRFERRRDAQIAEHLDRCREVIDSAEVERLFVVGERTVLGEFRDRAVRTATVDATGDPEEALETAFHEFWSARLARL